MITFFSGFFKFIFVVFLFCILWLSLIVPLCCILKFKIKIFEKHAEECCFRKRASIEK